ncbi:alpha-mannosidase [Stygiolobus caldivivus]|uniref:Alpha-mannosidase n=1 Tax=Stygiolobus caldivivus TaxID=2824673 RepID=A0A8D5ZEZ4_9CREN|nr:alpha-mannosidase [Stygiolobus caldivivus]BCU69958.1 alpha-mannosidase [Stygiolobus caldivivus]
MRRENEIFTRISFVLANSFYDIRYTEWAPLSGTTYTLGLENGDDNKYLMVLDYHGSALIKVNSEPYFALDDYHNTFPLPKGKVKIEADFSPFKAFGQRTEIRPGTPVTFKRNPSAYNFWVYANTTLQLAKLAQGYLKEKLLQVLTESLSLAPFASVSRDQLVLASHYWRDFPRHLLDFTQGMNYPEHSGSYEEALKALSEGVRGLRELFGKPGKMNAVAHAHIDTAWLWNFDETRRKVARTFSTVLNLMERYDFTFIQSMAIYYEWVKEDYPALFNKIKEKVKEGRWVLGAGWVEFDANLPAGESLVRQLLYSQQFYEENFGKKAEVLWLPDTFGFSAQLPQIMRLAEINLFATHKLFWSDTNKFPYSVFNWIGIDGSRVTAVAFGNGRGGYNSDFSVESVLEQWDNWKDKDQPLLYAYGHGDGGGGPTEDMLVAAKAIDQLPSTPSVELSGAHNYEAKENWNGELYVETHRGVYTSHSRMKYLHRRTEVALREAEIWSTIARSYDEKRLKVLWKTLLKDEFHDVLPGSAIKEVYETVYPELENVIKEADKVALDSIKRIAGEGDKLMVFNSLSWDREDYVVLGEEVEGGQRTEEGYLVRVRAPPLGYTELKPLRVNPVRLEGLIMENEYLKVKLNGDGTLASLYDKETGREALSSPSNKLVVYENIPGWADAWDIEPSYEDKKFELKAEKYEIKETGPFRACVRFYYTFRNSKVLQDVCLYAKSRRIDFKTTISMPDRELLLKSWFYFDLNTPEATFEVPYGVLKRQTTRNTSWEKAKFEVPMGKWLDLSEDDYGVAVLNDGKYGVAVEGNAVGLSLAKTPIYPDYTTDAEANSFTYSVYPHKGDWKEAKVYQRAYELNYPLKVVRGKGGEGSFVRVRPDNLVVEAIKGSEDKRGIVVRLYNVQNNRGEGEVELWFNPNKVERVNVLENPISGRVQLNGNKVRFNYRNYEIITIKLEG